MKTAMQDIQNMLEILWANTDVVTIESVLDYIRDKGIPSEKEQIMNANIEGTEHGYRERALFGLDARPYSKKRAEQYYNETYTK